MESTEGPEWNVMDEHTVADVMTRRVISLGRDATVREAARLMLEAGVHRILVLEDTRLVGLVTNTDILKAVSQYGIAG
jgi:CBS domain-containing protein